MAQRHPSDVLLELVVAAERDQYCLTLSVAVNIGSPQLDPPPGCRPYGGPMDGYSISRTAERTGFTISALRFYEREGLVRPARTEAGYRCYTEGDVAALRFIARAKSLGLALDQVAELV